MARLPYDRNINPFIAYGAVLFIGFIATNALLKAITLVNFAVVDPVRDLGL